MLWGWAGSFLSNEFGIMAEFGLGGGLMIVLGFRMHSWFNDFGGMITDCGGSYAVKHVCMTSCSDALAGSSFCNFLNIFTDFLFDLLVVGGF